MAGMAELHCHAQTRRLIKDQGLHRQKRDKLRRKGIEAFMLNPDPSCFKVYCCEALEEHLAVESAHSWFHISSSRSIIEETH
jgi:hypothetical protein